MKKYLIIAVSSAALLSGTTAFADDDSGWYLRANGGYGIHHDAEFDNGFFNGDIESEGNVTGSLGLGYEFGEGSDFENFRIELDGDTLWTDMGQIGQNVNSFAKLRTNTLMANVLYDFDGDNDYDGDGWNFVPYFGAGIGLVQGELDAEAHDSIAPAFGPINRGVIINPACLSATIDGQCSSHDKDMTWGYQLIAGLGVDIDENLTWDTHYTYMRADTGGLDFDGQYTPLFTNTAPLNPFNHQFELDDIGAHTLVTGLRYKFGESYTPPPPPPPAPVAVYKTCPDTGVRILEDAVCPAPPPPPVVEPEIRYMTCPDGTTMREGSVCPQPVTVTYSTCPDGSQVTDLAYCAPVETVVYQPTYNNCGPSNVAIFNVPVSSTPKQMSRLGTMPEFGDSHGLTPTEFYQKLQSRYNSSATDKAYLNYLFKSMGYTNGFRDANEFMFSEETLPVGTTGMLGLGEAHHYEYSVLPSNDRDRQAFRIQSANGQVIHFMKTCGNYMYACN